MMFDRTYRQRLEADLARWEADGVIAPAAVTAIRVALPPLAPGINIAVVVAIVGGLLIAAAFLAFVAAHWIEIARLSRLAILFAGILTAHGLGAWFARAGQPVLADLCAAVGAIVFGAGIALVGQMYHLGERLCRRHAAVGDGRARDSGVDRLARGACGGASCRDHMEQHADPRGA